MKTSEKTCEQYELDLSSLLDGELSPAAAAEAVEHALACAECAAFFRASRRVQGAAETMRGEDGELSESHADALWHEVERRAVETAPATRVAGGRWGARGLRAAALVTLGLGGGYLLGGLSRSEATGVLAQAGSGATVNARLTGSSAATTMDERRFVAVADELLSSDVRYQRAMLEVLRLVPSIETGEGLRTEDEPRVVRASDESERRSAGEI